jgi:hypothetical protein
MGNRALKKFFVERGLFNGLPRERIMKELRTGTAVVAVMVVCCSASLAQITFQADYDGNTANNGFDADFAAGDSSPAFNLAGQAIGVNAVINEPGVFGAKALDSTMPNGHVRYNTNVNVPAAGTIEMWFVAPEARNTAHLFWFSNTNFSTNASVQIYENATGLLYRNSAPGGDLGTTYDLVPGEWYYVAATWGPGPTDQSFYLGALSSCGDPSADPQCDVTLKGQGQGTTLEGLEHLTIGTGSLGNESHQHWGERIDHVRIFDFIRTEAQIEADMIPFEDCNDNGTLDSQEISGDPRLDCNLNDILDECDITAGTSADCDINNMPDECPGGEGAGPPPCTGETGDANGDGGKDLSDAIYGLSFLFQGGPPLAELCSPTGPKAPECAVKTGDVNGDGSIDLSDTVYLLGFLFQGGLAPVPPCAPAGETVCSDPVRHCCTNGVDDDSDGATDCADPDCVP